MFPGFDKIVMKHFLAMLYFQIIHNKNFIFVKLLQTFFVTHTMVVICPMINLNNCLQENNSSRSLKKRQENSVLTDQMGLQTFQMKSCKSSDVNLQKNNKEFVRSLPKYERW